MLKKNNKYSNQAGTDWEYLEIVLRIKKRTYLNGKSVFLSYSPFRDFLLTKEGGVGGNSSSWGLVSHDIENTSGTVVSVYRHSTAVKPLTPVGGLLKPNNWINFRLRNLTPHLGISSPTKKGWVGDRAIYFRGYFRYSKTKFMTLA